MAAASALTRAKFPSTGPRACTPRARAATALPSQPLVALGRGKPAPRLREAVWITAAMSQGGGEGAEDEGGGEGFNADLFRALPIWAGGVGGISLLVNRLLSGTAPVADASSAQSRADVLGLAMAACLILTGLQWKALEQRAPEQVVLVGTEVLELGAAVPDGAAAELRWCWEALRSATRCSSFVVFSGVDGCAIKAGFVSQECAAGKVQPSLGPICERALESGRGNYLANLVLFPGRSEFTSYLPHNTQGVVVQPVGEWGVIVAGTDTQRGFTRVDQAWIATLAEKLDVSLD